MMIYVWPVFLVLLYSDIAFSLARNTCHRFPCRPYARIRIVEGRPKCICIQDPNASPCSCPAATPTPCKTSNDCDAEEVCENSKCLEGCRDGACGTNAECRVRGNHLVICSCPVGYEGDPSDNCTKPDENPCSLLPCGSYEKCHIINGMPQCISIADTEAPPPGQCNISMDCGTDYVCKDTKCVKACRDGACGENAECRVGKPHVAICTCPKGYGGIPSESCTKLDPCENIKCGRYEECVSINSTASCRCISDSRQSAPNCKPQSVCGTDADCASNLACISRQCADPCRGACASNAECDTKNHRAVCYCPPRYTGDAFINCVPIQ